MPDSLLLNDIIKPIIEKGLNKKSFKPQDDNLAQNILAIYHYIKQHAPKEQPISPRNLEMLTLRFVSVCLQQAKQLGDAKVDLNTCLRTAAMAQAAQALVTSAGEASYQGFVNWYNQQYGEGESYDYHKSTITSLTSALQKREHTLTKSQSRPLSTLLDLLSIRKMRLANPELAKYGLRGLLWTGDPGVGKSTLGVKTLQSLGFVDGTSFWSFLYPTQRRYYHINVNKPGVMRAALLKAFHGGSVVLFDEANKLLMEELLNQLLTGYDDKDRPAEKEGFTLIVAQNDESLADRNPSSKAHRNRFEVQYFPAQPKAELIEIVDRIGVENSETFVEKFIFERNQAIQNGTHPPDNRKLFSEAKHYAMNMNKGQYNGLILHILFYVLCFAATAGAILYFQALPMFYAAFPELMEFTLYGGIAALSLGATVLLMGAELTTRLMTSYMLSPVFGWLIPSIQERVMKEMTKDMELILKGDTKQFENRLEQKLEILSKNNKGFKLQSPPPASGEKLEIR